MKSRLSYSLFLAIGVLLAAPSGFAQDNDANNVSTPSDLAEAKERFEQGIALAKAGNCRGAIAELKASFKLAPRTNTLFNIARCQEDLFRYTNAVSSYEAYLKIATEDDPDRPAVESTIRALKNLLGTVVIKSNVEATVWVGERVVGKAPGEILVPGGHHVIELRADGHLPNRLEIDIAGRQSIDIEIDLEVTKKVELTEVTKVTNVTHVEKSGLKPVYFWTGIGLTSAAMIGGATFGFRANSQQRDAESIDSRLPRDNERDAIDSSKTKADIFFIAAGALAVGTTVIYFLTDWNQKEHREKNMSIAPAIGNGTLGLVLGGTL